VSRILVACEYSGRVRQAFAARGHDAWSCDLLPSEDAGLFHIQGDVLSVLGDGWDLMVCHPPCTYLTNSGERWMKDNPERQALRLEAVEFARALLDAPIPCIALENPVGHLSSALRKPDQIIQPYHFGHLERKTTCLWLKNLPPLKWTDDKTAEAMALTPAERDRVHWMPPGPDRWKDRSRTYTGIAEAMAEQWGAVDLAVESPSS
jgi:hypothetical protein